MTRGGPRWLVVAALAVLIAGLSVTGAGAAEDEASLVVSQRTEETGTTFVEGFVQFAELRRGGEVVARGRLDERATTVLTAASGGYTLVSFTRSCVGVCPPKVQASPSPGEPQPGGGFDPPTGHCSTSVRLGTGGSAEATVVARPGESCVLEAGAPGGGQSLPRTGGLPGGAPAIALLMVLGAAIGLGWRHAMDSPVAEG